MKGAHCPERWAFIRLAPQAGFGSVPVEQLRSKDAAFAFCTECSCKVDYTSGSTTAVKKHMQRFHMEALLKAKQAKEEAKALKANRQLENCYNMVPATSKRQAVAVTSDQ
ncbi:hypothetical protein PF005_g28338 [Phytophthora fragariae]|nr:hypothetical protein PF009_g22830 [Phytophthora fragariae]KAE9067723.1 hypothetical protein PF010_g27352 [Phytophthora fragariae]KAE9085376.1 hypothetical protein PF006_g26268 [Phytophthora fragariae]KAE9168528.1 hypothetical protein PF005_g28338 [Phytophthora fragariae]KAE9194280.1 hypothetical protein PF004_g20764 [Phytophthora fragariae]